MYEVIINSRNGGLLDLEGARKVFKHSLTGFYYGAMKKVKVIKVSFIGEKITRKTVLVYNEPTNLLRGAKKSLSKSEATRFKNLFIKVQIARLEKKLQEENHC